MFRISLLLKHLQSNRRGGGSSLEVSRHAPRGAARHASVRCAQRPARPRGARGRQPRRLPSAAMAMTQAAPRQVLAAPRRPPHHLHAPRTRAAATAGGARTGRPRMACRNRPSPPPPPLGSLAAVATTVAACRGPEVALRAPEPRDSARGCCARRAPKTAAGASTARPQSRGPRQRAPPRLRAPSISRRPRAI